MRRSKGLSLQRDKALDEELPSRKRHALVLLSGGFDSVAALHWAAENYDEMRAVSFDYGQVNRDAELYAAQWVAERRHIQWDRLVLADAVKGLGSLRSPTPGLDAHGVSRANLAARNPLLLSVAAGHAHRLFPPDYAGRLARIDLIIGATLDDAVFPDCREEFFESFTQVLALGCAGVADLQVRAPWVQKRKKEVLLWCQVRPQALEDVRLFSVSCYAGTRCGTCDPCALRARAFAECNIEDGNAGQPMMIGGDPARARA